MLTFIRVITMMQMCMSAHQKDCTGEREIALLAAKALLGGLMCREFPHGRACITSCVHVKKEVFLVIDIVAGPSLVLRLP
jgi:hypothetical protein